MENLDIIIGKNISKYRKKRNMTQIELAEKLNFSDKTISKWERGESKPELETLVEICKIFDVKLDDMLSEKEHTPRTWKFNIKNRTVISLLSVGLVWLVATIAFVFLDIFSNLNHLWLAFIYAIPVSFVVLVVFCCLWGPKWTRALFISCLIWTIPVAICLTFEAYIWKLLYIAIPLQILTILWFMLEKKKNT